VDGHVVARIGKAPHQRKMGVGMRESEREGRRKGDERGKWEYGDKEENDTNGRKR
jgi:hypothetical protein